MIKLATVFSGIGAVEHALKRMNIDHEIVFACDNGDVDIFSKKLDPDICLIRSEIKELSSLINQIKKNKSCDHIEVQELSLMLKKSKLLYDELIDSSNVNDQPFIDAVIGVLSQLSNIDKISKAKRKNYISLREKIESVNAEYDKFLYSQVAAVMFDNELKKASIKKCIKRQDLKILKDSMEKYNVKRNVKRIKDLAERVGMLHEKINILLVKDNLKEIESFDERKEYIDDLYKKYSSKNKVKQSYLANYSIDESNFHWNITFLEGEKYKDQVDLFVGGSPCQSFSLVGKQRGLEDTRGTLFYEFARLVDEIQPKVFIYENVKAVLTNDNGRTWETMQKVFTDLNYDWVPAILNAKDYGIPQNRERVFVVGFRKKLPVSKKYEPPKPVGLNGVTMKDFLLDNVAGKYYLPPKGVDFVTDEKNLKKQYTQIDGEIQLCQKKNQQFNWHGDFVFEEENIDSEKTMKDLEKYFLSEKVRKYVLNSGTKGFYSKPEIDLDVARPLLTTMHKMHRAGVDNYVTSEGRLRKLTPRECLRLMGFCDSFSIEVSDTAMYQQSGNSIVVDVLIAIINEIVQCYEPFGEGEQ